MIRKLKTVYIHETFVNEFGKLESAAIMDVLLQIENKNGVGNWFKTTAKELVEESMLGITETTLRKYFNKMISNGYVDKEPRFNKEIGRYFEYRITDKTRELTKRLASIYDL